jgi:hypothetical protein
MTKETAYLYHRHVVYSVSAPTSRGPRTRPNCETEIIGIGGDDHNKGCLVYMSYVVGISLNTHRKSYQGCRQPLAN